MKYSFVDRRFVEIAHKEDLKLIDERVESLRNNPEYKDMTEEGDLREKVIKDLGNSPVYASVFLGVNSAN